MYTFTCGRYREAPSCGEQQANYMSVRVIVNEEMAKFIIDATCLDCGHVTSEPQTLDVATALVRLGAERISIGSTEDEATHKRTVPGLQEIEAVPGGEVLAAQLRSVEDIGALERGFPI